MKRLNYILILLPLIFVSQKAFGTAQIPDYLIYEGDTLKIYSNPLESYFEDHPRPDKIFKKYGYKSTACWRGYIAYWELKNDSLFLIEIHGDSTIIDKSLIFKEKEIKDRIYADWYSNSILNPHGKLLQYVHMGYSSIYEFEKEFIFEKGILKRINNLDNSKSKKSIYTEKPELLKKYIKENIDYSKITNKPFEKANVFVQILSVTEEGKIDSVVILRGYDEERDLEALRVVKSIPDWDVLYWHGKLYNQRWNIPVIFGKEE